MGGGGEKGRLQEELVDGEQGQGAAGPKSRDRMLLKHNLEAKLLLGTLQVLCVVPIIYGIRVGLSYPTRE